MLPFADEILVTKTFLDDKQRALADLEGQVEELSNQIWTAAVEGSYIVAPAMVEGREPVRFKGP